MSFTLHIEPDTDAENPRSFDYNLGRMVCFHRRYMLGDRHTLSEDDFESWGDIRKRLVAEEDAKIILPLYLMDHSGVSMSAEPFGCPWDSGQVGWIYVGGKRLCEEFGADWAQDESRVVEALKAEVAVYDKYLSGDVWGYVIRDAFGEEVDSCWGYYGWDDAELEGNWAIEAIEARCTKEGHAKIKLELQCSTAAFADDFEHELDRILAGVKEKTLVQLAREPGCVCEAAEDDDILRDSRGNRVGSLAVTRSVR